MTTYTCSACGAPATVKNGIIYRTCQCNKAVVAHMKAHATGKSSTGTK